MATFDGTASDDLYTGTADPDLIHGNGGDDTLSGGLGDDLITGDSGNDSLSGDGDNDTLTGGDGQDQLFGGDGDDWLDGGLSFDLMSGGTGNDHYVVNNPNDSLAEDTGGIDTLETSVTYYLNDENIEIVVLTGSADIDANGGTVANSMTGNSGSNRLAGNEGNDIINAGGGADEIIGGAGNDTVHGDAGGDTIRGDSWGNGNDALYGDAGNDFIVGEDGNDSLFGGDDNDLLKGLAGDDHIEGGNGNDYLDGGDGIDELRGGAGDDEYLLMDLGDTVIEAAGEGFDTVNTKYSFDAATQAIEKIRLIGDANLRAWGNDLANSFTGNAGINLLYGRGGNDVYFVQTAGDRAIELAGEGHDTVFSSISFTIEANVEDLRLTGTAVAANGNAGANMLDGNGSNNVLDGRAGADRMYGRAGDDIFIVDNSGDLVFEEIGEGSDLVQASVSFSLAGQNLEALTLTGAAAINGTGNGLANTLTGNGAANVLDGGYGNDALHGGLGADTLIGSRGLDSYWFETALGAGNVDTLADFKTADDTIYLDRSIFTGIAADGALAAGAFRMGSVAIDADDRILYDKVNGDLYYDADGAGGAAAVLFAHVAGSAPMTSADFFAVA